MSPIGQLAHLPIRGPFPPDPGTLSTVVSVAVVHERISSTEKTIAKYSLNTLIYHRGGDQSPIAVSKSQCSAAVFSNRATGAEFLCGQRSSQRWPIRPPSSTPLKVGHRRHRLEWYKEHKNWTSYHCSDILFMYESRFSATSGSQFRLTLRKAGTRFHPSNIMEGDRYGDLGVVI
ncbi:hypothetical protein TNCV_2465681 [Trichonephila clavipes]|uniref:Uncharacterized protein n=1 Tax=Trichonephila clavipes TaxID=2585209 RepID=A0A8X6RC59_TRICX|nr:hypothetical protein TNCV_2465681 [Trichonephila clavipes]